MLFLSTPGKAATKLERDPPVLPLLAAPAAADPETGGGVDRAAMAEVMERFVRYQRQFDQDPKFKEDLTVVYRSAGTRAHQRGDYATAAREFRPLAERGYSFAQLLLGMMYHDGRGVRQDFAEAAKWYRKAAEKGKHAEAQVLLGALHYNGSTGVPQDDVQAYMWLSLASAQGFAKATVGRKEAAERLTSPQRAEAQRLAIEWIKKYTSGN